MRQQTHVQYETDESHAAAEQICTAGQYGTVVKYGSGSAQQLSSLHSGQYRTVVKYGPVSAQQQSSRHNTSPGESHAAVVLVCTVGQHGTVVKYGTVKSSRVRAAQQ